MKWLFKGLFYSRRRRGAAAPTDGEGAATAAAREEKRRRMSDVGELGRSLCVMGLSDMDLGKMGFDEMGDVGEDEVEGDHDGATPNFGATMMAVVTGQRFTRSSTRVERSEVATGEGSGSGTRKKKVVSKPRQAAESPPPHCEMGCIWMLGMLKKYEHRGRARRAVMRGVSICPRADLKRMRGAIWEWNGEARCDMSLLQGSRRWMRTCWKRCQSRRGARERISLASRFPISR